MIYSYERFLESKGYNTLYHILDYRKLNYVLETNTIRSYTAGGGRISLTRDKMFNSYLGATVGTIFKLEIDGRKLSSKYKISPFRYKTHNAGYLTEYEEQVKASTIKNVFKYIKRIVILKEEVERMKYDYDKKISAWFSTEGTRSNDNLPFIIKNLKEKIEKNGFELWVQDGSIIKKDDEWLDSIINFDLIKIERKYIILYRGIRKYERFKTVDVLIDNDRNTIFEPFYIGSKIYNLDNFNFYEMVDKDDKKYKDLDSINIDDIPYKPYRIELTKVDDYYKITDAKPINW
jgi:hypothetical protein